MTTIYDAIYSEEPRVTTLQIQASVDACRNDLRTGLIRLAYSPEEHLYLFFKRGSVLTSTFTNSLTERALTQEQWQEKIQTMGDAHLKYFRLSPFGLYVSRLLMQTQAETPEIIFKQNQLNEYFERMSVEKEPALVRLNWQYASGVIFFPGDRKDLHSIFISQDTILDGSGINKAIFELTEQLCAVSTFTLNPSVNAWQEYRLRCLFADISNLLTERFEALTGRSLANSLIRLLLVFAREHDLDISISARKIQDQEVFDSPQSAAQNYRLYLNELFTHCAIVIGPRLLASTLREIVAKLPRYEQDMINTYGLLPGGYFYE